MVAARILSLCTGISGLDKGVKQTIHARVVGYCERDAYAAAVLLARMEEGLLDLAPLWCGDIRQLDGRIFHRKADIITAGYPCQPFSLAGKRLGKEDERHIWPEVYRIVREVEPSYVFLENVYGHISLGLDTVLADLASAGFAAEWGTFRASEVGSPHLRKRVFILAHSRRRSDNAHEHIAESRSCGTTSLGPVGEGVAHSKGERLGEARGDRERSEKRPLVGSEGLAHADAPRRSRPENRAHQGRTRSVERSPTFPASWPPGPSDAGGWAEWLGRGGPPPAVSGVRGVFDGFSSRMDVGWTNERLRCLGNSVVPQQAALAFQTLLARLGT